MQTTHVESRRVQTVFVYRLSSLSREELCPSGFAQAAYEGFAWDSEREYETGEGWEESCEEGRVVESYFGVSPVRWRVWKYSLYSCCNRVHVYCTPYAGVTSAIDF